MRISHVVPAACLLAAGMAAAQSTLLFSKNGAPVFSITEDGSLSNFTGYYSENAPGTAATGELVFSESTQDGTQEMLTTPAGNLFIKSRVYRQAVMPTTTGHLVLRPPEGWKAATLTKGGELFLRGYANFFANPGGAGAFSYTSAIYASSGTQVIPRYMSPTSNYTTPRKNISPFFNSVDEFSWGFNATSVPLNGILRIPGGTGPFPLALFVHGNHDPFDYSDTGYVYLCNMLASQGIIAGTIDANFLNGGWQENDARAILHLEHVKQFRTWNAQSGHPLFGKVDMNRVMIAGHSRGGEAAAHASYFNGLSSVVADPGGPTIPLTGGSNGLGPYNFGIRNIFAIAPTVEQYTPVGGHRGVDKDYFVIHGGRDDDLDAFWGLATYDRSHKPNVGSPSSNATGFKALAFAYRANHNYFNTSWDADGDPSQAMGRADQEILAKVYVGALAQAQLLGRTAYLEMLKDPFSALNIFRPPSSTYVTQFQDRTRTFFNHYEEDANPSTLSPPFTGSNMCFCQSFVETDLQSEANSWHRTKGMRLDWSFGSGLYAITMNAATPNYQFLSVRVGQNNSTNNPVGGSQQFYINAVDGSGNWATVPTSNYGSLPYPHVDVAGNRPAVMQTFRVPLSEFANQGLNPNDIRGVQFEFGTLVENGSVYFDEFQFTF